MAYPIRFSINNMRRYHNLFCPKAIIAFTYKQNGLLIGCKFRTMEKIFGRRGCRQSTGFRVFAGMVEWGTRFKVRLRPKRFGLEYWAGLCLLRPKVAVVFVHVTLL
nr:uncharacterized protein LOC112791274 [Arachis hypogaea]